METPRPPVRDPVPWEEVTSFVCYYGSFAEQMGLFDVAILESKNITPDRMAWLRAHGAYTIAYISVGEDDALREDAPYYVEKDGQPVQNGNWGSYFVDAGNAVWQEIIIERAGEILASGCDGLFLDTIDTAEIYPKTRDGMASLIRALHEAYPDAKLVANRGMFMLGDFAPYISGLMFEDFSNGYDFDKRDYRPHSENDLQWTSNEAKKINRIREETYFPVFALDYADPDDAGTIQFCYDRAWSYDFIPAVSVIMLDRVIWNDVTPRTERGAESGLSRWNP